MCSLRIRLKEGPADVRLISWRRPVTACADTNDLRSCWSRLATSSSASYGWIMALIASITPSLVQGWSASAPGHWPKSVAVDVLDTLLFPGEQPFNTLHELPTDPKQDFRPNFDLAAFHNGEIVLADFNFYSTLSLPVNSQSIVFPVLCSAVNPWTRKLKFALSLK